MHRSHVRYSAAGFLTAVGLLLGGTGGMAIADPDTHHDRYGNNDGPGGFGRAGGLGEGQTSGGAIYRPGAGPRTRVGNGRVGMPGVHLDRGGYAPRAGSSEFGSAAEQAVGEETSGVEAGGIGRAGGYRGGNLFRPTIHVPFPSPTTGWPGSGWAGVYGGWGTLQLPTVALPTIPLPTVPNPLGPPQPTPQPNIRSQIAGPEPVNSTGGGGGGEAPQPAVAEPPVVRAPLVVAPEIPVRPVPPPTVVNPPVAPGPATAPNARIGPGAPAEPAPISPPARIGQSVAPPQSPQPAGGPMGAEAPLRVGYNAYLRTAGTAQLAAVALPGVAGLVFLTASGGLVGYRQAKAGQSVRSPGIGRFLR